MTTEYYGRSNGGKLTWDLLQGVNSRWPDSEWCRVYEIDNVVDLIFLDKRGRWYSIKPTVLKDVSIPKSRTLEWEYIPAYSKNKNPLNMDYTPNAGVIKDLLGDDVQMATQGVEEAKLKDMPYWRSNGNVWAAQYEQIKYKQAGTDKAGISHDGANYYDFARVYSNVSALQSAMSKGYKLFYPSDLRHPSNWYCRSASGDYRQYMLIMYMDASSAALNLGCFNPSNTSDNFKTAMKRLFQSSKLTNRDLLLNMGNSFCKARMPSSYTSLPTGNYYMGTTIYSPNTKYKFIILPDGDLVIYGITNTTLTGLTTKWSSGTKLKEYDCEYESGKTTKCKATKPWLSIQKSDGNIVLRSRDKVVLWNGNTRGSNMRLGLTNDGKLIAFKGNNPSNIEKSFNGDPNKEWLETISTIMNDSCDTSDYRNVQNDSTSLRDLTLERLKYCAKDNNFINHEKCKAFYGWIPNDDGKELKIKADTYYDKICTIDNVNKQNNEKLRIFCAGKVPYDEYHKKLADANIPLSCFGKALDTGAYRAKTFLETTCNMQACIQDQSLANVANGYNIQQTCEMNNNPIATSPSSATDATTGSSASDTSAGSATDTSTTTTSSTNTTTTTPSTQSSSSSPSSASTQSSSSKEETTEASTGLSDAAIAGIVISVVAFFLFIVVIAVFKTKRGQQMKGRVSNRYREARDSYRERRSRSRSDRHRSRHYDD